MTLTKAGAEILRKAAAKGGIVSSTEMIGAAGTACVRRLIAGGHVAFVDGRWRITNDGRAAIGTEAEPNARQADVACDCGTTDDDVHELMCASFARTVDRYRAERRVTDAEHATHAVLDRVLTDGHVENHGHRRRGTGCDVCNELYRLADAVGFDLDASRKQAKHERPAVSDRPCTASAACPICGDDQPHAHDRDEVQVWATNQVARWGYETTLARFGTEQAVATHECAACGAEKTGDLREVSRPSGSVKRWICDDCEDRRKRDVFSVADVSIRAFQARHVKCSLTTEGNRYVVRKHDGDCSAPHEVSVGLGPEPRPVSDSSCQAEKPACAPEDGVHELKTWPQFFVAIVEGRKRFEVRKNDRGFRIGDKLVLREWATERGYTGRWTCQTVTYLVSGAPFLPDDTCVMGIEPGYLGKSWPFTRQAGES